MPTPTAEATVEFHDDRRDLVTNNDTGEKHYVFYGEVSGWAEALPEGNVVWCYVPGDVLRDCFGTTHAQDGDYQDSDYNAVYLANKERIQAKAQERILAGDVSLSTTPLLHYNLFLTRADYDG